MRGADSGFKSRLKTSGYRFNFQSKLALTVALIAFMLTGGSVIMYALRDYIGEEKVNAALAKYIKNVARQDAPFTTSLEFPDHIREVVPDTLQYIMEDWFETITLYDNRATETKYTSNDDGAFKVTLTFESHKMRADSLGLETEIPLADWIDIGVLGKDGKELYWRKHKIPVTTGTIEITVKPTPDARQAALCALCGHRPLPKGDFGRAPRAKFPSDQG